MIKKDDWRLTAGLVRGHEEKLKNIPLWYIPFQPLSDRWDHEHCMFCWAKFYNHPECLQEGYCSQPENSPEAMWICPECYADFKDMFGWTRIPPNNIREKMAQYRQQLLSSGMQEPLGQYFPGWHWQFYMPTTELTAFIVNLRGGNHSVEVIYGYASTAFTRMKGDEQALIQAGVSDKDITIREKLVLRNAADEEAARERVTALYRTYLQTEKDALLEAAKAKRKAFLQQINAKLKPMGFRKKGNKWTRALEGAYQVSFDAQKSIYSDQYYFNLLIGPPGTVFGGCYNSRIAPQGMSPMDWQLHGEAFTQFLEGTVAPALERIIHTPLRELGNCPNIWAQCYCKRQSCGDCWVKKNHWEANPTQTDA